MGNRRHRTFPVILAVLVGLLAGVAAPAQGVPVVPGSLAYSRSLAAPSFSSLAASVEDPSPSRGVSAADPDLARPYFGARYYASGIGQFTTVDPIMTMKANLVDPQRWNRYAYARNNPLKFVDPNGEDTYVVIYGGPYLNSAMQGQHGDVGRGFQQAAATYAKGIESSPGFNAQTDAIVTVEARSTDQFVAATNNQYPSGKIAGLAVFSHGYGSGVSLGGEAGNRAQLLDYDQREINYSNVNRIDASNFTETAAVDLFGCNCGNGIAATLAGHLGGKRRVGGFTGPAEFKTTPDGVTMVPTYSSDQKQWYPQ